jgi:isopenicillin-N epimerase
MLNELKKLFLLDPHIHFLNHGSFGACPIPVFQAYQKWQIRLENQPVEFLGREIITHMGKAREKLAKFVNCQPDELVYFPNPTTAINMIARNLALQPGDEIFATNHEYGAMDRTWRFIAEKTGALYINHPIPLPMTTKEEFIENFWSGVTENTKVIFLSHITSPTALTFPVEEVCHRARSSGIFSIVDGAHVPGQISLDLERIGPDVYTGACHKWLCAPKGSAFLFARKEVQSILKPLVVSWGYQAEEPGPSQFIDYHEWQGTRDMSAFLAVPSAIEFQEKYEWEDVRKDCHELLLSALNEINQLTGLASIDSTQKNGFSQMASIQLPNIDEKLLKHRLYDEFRIEIPIFTWENYKLLRISVQGYNNEKDIQALIRGLKVLIPETTIN